MSMSQPRSRRVPLCQAPLVLLTASLILGGCFPNADELELKGAAGGTGPATGGNNGSGGSTTDGPTVTDGPNPGTTDGPGRDVVIPDVAGTNCADLAAVWCARAQECEPRSLSFMVAGLECPTRLTAWCNTFLAAPKDTNWTPAAFKNCVSGLASISCEGWLSTNEYLKGQACLVGGNRHGGQGCASWAQCDNVRCETWGECGVCRPRSQTEGKCQSDVDCAFGLMCSPNNKCKVPLGLGGRCSAEDPCHPTLRCAPTGLCAPLGGIGDACKVHADCDLERYLLCNATTKKCGPAKPAPMWNNNNADGSVFYCDNSASAAGMGACLPRVKDDDTGCVVSGSDGRRCIFPALCTIPAGATTGTCTVPTFTDCPAVRPDPPAGGYLPGQDPWCPSIDYPTFCQGRNDVGPNCWDARTNCATTVNCKGELFACDAATTYYDCQLAKCGPTCTPPAGATPCDECVSRKCCGSKTICDGDPACVAKMGPNWTTLQTCQRTYCAAFCP